jgi:signal transduction histidine kinase
MHNTGAAVYVVDDDASVREAVGGLIRSAGLRAESFSSAQEFLAGARAEVPGCLVLDVELPGLSGLDLQQELAKADVQIPIIFLTGRGDIPMSVRAMKAGALEFLTKPVDDEVLLNAIRMGIAHCQTLSQQRRGTLLSLAAIDEVRLEERVNERTRIARELHDTLLQSFQGAMLRFQVGVDRLPAGETKDVLEKALETGDQAIVEGREAIHDLRASTMVANDLVQAVRALGDELASQDSPRFRLVVEGRARNLPPILRGEICRIAREAVRNAFRHAQARRIEAEITYSDKLLRLRIRDDGRGLDPGIVEEGVAGHYGLAGMLERATQIGGQLNVWSRSGTGTEVELNIPGSIAYGTAPARTRWWRRLQRVE